MNTPVHELARQLGVDITAVLGRANVLGIAAHSGLSLLAPRDVERIRRSFAGTQH